MKKLLTLLALVASSLTFWAQTPENLYLLGDATSAGWDNTAALEMTEISSGLFSINAEINGTGPYVKFIVTLGQWAPQYGTDESGTSSSGNLVYRETESEPDPLAIPAPQTAGTYTILANLNDLTYTISGGFAGDLVVTDPEVPTDNNPVTITFDASQGSAGLAGYSGDVYAHTGVITNLSSDGSDWKYVKTDWGENTDETLLTRIEGDIYELEIGPSIREYYGVPETETIIQMAFVFRSGEMVDGAYLEGKTESGGDIFVNVFETGLNLTVYSPDDQSFYQLGEDVEAHALVTPVGTGDVTNFEILVDDELIASNESNEITATFQFDQVGDHTIVFSADNGTYQATDTVDVFVIVESSYAELPEGAMDGLNYGDDSVTFVLHAPYKDFVLLIGDFNNWELSDDYMMYKTPDDERYWFTVTDLNPDMEYRFQYFVDGEIKIADPYVNKILDPWNDQYIPESTYPNLIEYPHEYTEEIVGVFQINANEYEWEADNFQAPEVEDLVIYELLIRDFVETRDIKTITDTLDYLEELGVNAIELMPFNEFEGNDSWGYNPSFYFATDKYYGTANDFKAFIDACHQRGIAVIMDMVLNHSYGQSPFLRLYMENWQPTEENPWYNTDCPHEPWCWGSDFDHSSQLVKDLIDRINAYWLTEFKVDGFRFDFTKGFTNTVSDGWAYDPQRIANLKRMADEIWEVNPDAYVILEHLTENTEEEDLAEYGMLLWGNMNYSYNEATMGYHDFQNGQAKSDFSWISYQERGWSVPHVVGYMESHDEERLMAKNLAYGNSSGNYDITQISTAFQRIELAAPFFISIPGPKMIWQFGELGYNFHINYPGEIGGDEHRLTPKPIRWDFVEDTRRYRIYKIFSSLIDLKKNYEVFSTDDYTLNLSEALKSIQLNHATMDVNILGNFDVEAGDIDPRFQQTGMWYEYFKRDSLNVTSVNQTITLEPGEYRLYTTVKLADPEIPYNVSQVLQSNSISVYPNPSDNEFNIFVEGWNFGEPVIEIINLYGQTIKHIHTYNQNYDVLNVIWNGTNDAGSETESGLYFIRIMHPNGSAVQRLIKY